MAIVKHFLVKMRLESSGVLTELNPKKSFVRGILFWSPIQTLTPLNRD